MRRNAAKRRHRPRATATRWLLRIGLRVAAISALWVPQVAAQDDRAVQTKVKPVEISHSQRRWAFLVSINDYVSHPRLKYCHQECTLISRVTEQLDVLSGKADPDGDRQVTLTEIKRCLGEAVPGHTRSTGQNHYSVMRSRLIGDIVLSAIEN